MSAKVPSFPDATAPFIQGLLCVFRKRSKSIKHRVREWEIELTSDDGEERINFDFRTWHGSQIRLAAWQTGEMWFRSCKRGPSKIGGWEFNFAFHLNTNDTTYPQIVDAFMKSYAAEDESAALNAWALFAPEVDHTVR